MSFTLAIVGRPNVGKSTLFNRLVGKRLALVDDTPGVTRDRRSGEAKLSDLRFTIFDTAGLEEGKEGSLSDRMRKQTAAGIAEADLVLMLFDARTGVVPMDVHFAEWLRRSNKPVILGANKCEGKMIIEGLYDAYSLGLGEPVGLSAEHGEGLAELYGVIVEQLRAIGIDPYADEEDEEDNRSDSDSNQPEEGDLDFEFNDEETESGPQRPLRLAIVGRPNAGKSTLINYLVGEERLITGPEAGLTRDSIAVDWEWEGKRVKLFDTAGMRKKARVQEKLEKLSVTDSLRAIQFAEVVVLLLDAERGIETQDLKIAEHIVREGRALVIVLNKWDAVDDRIATQKTLTDALTRSLPQLKGAQVLNFSGLTGQGVQKLMPAVEEVYDLWNARIPTSALNKWLADTIENHAPPAVSGRRIRIRYGAQIKTRPPTFLLFCNRPEDLPDSYKRYLENEIRRAFDIPGTPLRIIFRKTDNPYEGRRKKRK
jgi:GTPase